MSLRTCYHRALFSPFPIFNSTANNWRLPRRLDSAPAPMQTPNSIIKSTDSKKHLPLSLSARSLHFLSWLARCKRVRDPDNPVTCRFPGLRGFTRNFRIQASRWKSCRHEVATRNWTIHVSLDTCNHLLAGVLSFPPAFVPFLRPLLVFSAECRRVYRRKWELAFRVDREEASRGGSCINGPCRGIYHCFFCKRYGAVGIKAFWTLFA